MSPSPIRDNESLEKMLMSKKKEMSRRKFLTEVAAGGAACAIVPRHVLGRGFTPPSDTLNIAGVGVGGMGRTNLINLSSQNIVALCDVDWGYAGKRLDRLDIDIERLKKRIELPAPPPPGELPGEFDPIKAQARVDLMVKLKTEHVPKARRYTDFRDMLEHQTDIDAVVVATPDHMHAPIALAAMEHGKHVYVQKPLCWSVEEARKLSRRAKETKVVTQMGNQGHSSDEGRTAVEYLWAGAIDDMGAHLIDHTMWALDLGFPTSVETVSTPFNGASYPHATLTFYEFPARSAMPPVKLTWYDGGLKPNKPEELGDEELNKEGGALLIGSKGKLLYDTYGFKPRLLPKSLHESFGKPPQKLPRIAGQAHEMNWADACKGKVEASCPFEYAARLTEVMLLGIVALRAGKKIYYDGPNMRVTNALQANDFLRREYRQGWSI